MTRILRQEAQKILYTEVESTFSYLPNYYFFYFNMPYMCLEKVRLKVFISL